MILGNFNFNNEEVMKVFALLVVALIIWVGIWRSAAGAWKKRGHGKVVRNLGGASGGFIVSFIFLLVFMPTSNHSEPATTVASATGASSSAATPPINDGSSSISKPLAENTVVETAASDVKAAEAEEPKATFEVTISDYQKNFNRIMRQVNLDFRANLRLEKHADNIDIYQTILNNHLMIMVSVDKNSEKLTNVVMYGTGDGTTKSGVNVVSVAVAAMTSVFPNGQTKVVGPEVVSLSAEYTDGDKEPSTRIFNGVKFLHIRNESVGSIFSASPI
ncbi:hypothetical protein [Burkholderia gladioli]|uniref:hypothetical protein n=1 Tax=Burkholderia gladioli TaxID=28095 RepID=UPI000F51DF1C|nr:hypothetical protein [Burkholderia gladioli]NRF82771.1 hypothetical protein [Burkholderia gladioli]